MKRFKELSLPGQIFRFAWIYFLCCLGMVLFTFWRFDGVIQPSLLQGRAGSDGYVAASIGEWGLSELREHGEVPKWNPYIYGGMPTEGAMLFVTSANPVGMASADLNGFRGEWEVPSNPIKFNFVNVVGNTIKVFLGPLGFAVLAVVSLYYLVVS